MYFIRYITLKNSIKKQDEDNEHSKGPGDVARNKKTKGTSEGIGFRQEGEKKRGLQGDGAKGASRSGILNLFL